MVVFGFSEITSKMLVDAMWTMFLSYLVRNELEPEANLRTTLAEIRRLVGNNA